MTQSTSPFRPIRWAADLGTSLPTPFQRGANERTLRFTLHSESLCELPQLESEALAVLRDTARESCLGACETQSGSFAHLDVDVGSPEDQVVPIALRYRNGGWQESVIGGSHQGANVYAQFAAHFVDNDGGRAEVEAMRRELLLVTAHKHFGLDLFITCSERLLRHRESNLLREANPLRPSEAVPIVGLYLRSRCIYSPGVVGRWRRTDRRTLYHLTGYHLLPEVLRSAQACAVARPANKSLQSDPLNHSAGSIRLRMQTALEALDEINSHFYSVNGWAGTACRGTGRTTMPALACCTTSIT